MLTDADLMPFDPPAQPLRGLSMLWTLGRNYIETYPRSTYEQGVTRYQWGTSDVLYVCDPAIIHEMLVDKADAFSRDEVTYRAFTPVIGRSSLFLAEGSDWRWQRRAVAPIFRHEMLLSFVPTIAVIAERQVERWRTRPLDVPVETAAAMTRSTFEIIVEAILGGSARLDAERYGRALAAIFNTIPWHLLLSVLRAPAWTPFPGRWRARRASDFLRADIGRIIAKRRANASPHPDLLDLLLAARDADTGRSMNDAELVANLLTFVSAGHETTAVALTWTLWLLAKDEAVQRHVYDEAVAVMGHGSVEIDHIDALPLTRQVILEAMRLFPPVPMLARIPKAAIQLGGLAITPRTWIGIPIFALHRNKLLWDNPLAFDPDRFLPDQAKGRSRYAHLPFGAGPRVCIGANFAMIEAVVIIATLVRAFRFETVPGHKARPIARLTLRPAGGIPLFIGAR
jgi:cytochrome P450